MYRPSALHALTAAALAVVVALPLTVATGVLPAVADGRSSDPSSPRAWASAARAAQLTASSEATDPARTRGRQLLARRVVEQATAERAALEKAAAQAAAQAAAEKAAADALAARAAEAERASRAQRNADPRRIARSMLAERGQGDQFGCLDRLWTKESEWRVDADNPTSSAYGIPQALPGRKMATAGADWRTNPATQIRWGLGYIAEVYGSPCAAWKHSQARNWY